MNPTIVFLFVFCESCNCVSIPKPSITMALTWCPVQSCTGPPRLGHNLIHQTHLQRPYKFRPHLIYGMNISLKNKIVITMNKREWNEWLFILFNLVTNHIYTLIGIELKLLKKVNIGFFIFWKLVGGRPPPNASHHPRLHMWLADRPNRWSTNHRK
jgi:hypothetical protein